LWPPAKLLFSSSPYPIGCTLTISERCILLFLRNLVERDVLRQLALFTLSFVCGPVGFAVAGGIQFYITSGTAVTVVLLAWVILALLHDPKHRQRQHDVDLELQPVPPRLTDNSDPIQDVFLDA
jgi:hypothetical protein